MLKIEMTLEEASNLRGILDLALKAPNGGLLIAEAVLGFDRSILKAAEAAKATGSIDAPDQPNG